MNTRSQHKTRVMCPKMNEGIVRERDLLVFVDMRFVSVVALMLLMAFPAGQ